MYSILVKMSTTTHRFGKNEPTEFQRIKVSDIKKFPVRVIAPPTDAQVYGYQLVHIMFENDKVIFKDEYGTHIKLDDDTFVGIIPKIPKGYVLYNFLNLENNTHYIGILITIITKRHDSQATHDLQGKPISVNICNTRYYCYCFDKVWQQKVFGNAVIRPIRPLR